MFRSTNKKISETHIKTPFLFMEKTKAENYIINNLKIKTKYCIGRIFSTTIIIKKKII